MKPLGFVVVFVAAFAPVRAAPGPHVPGGNVSDCDCTLPKNLPTEEAIQGMADLHTHPFAEAQFGGRWFWGTMAEQDIAKALKACDGDWRTHAGIGGGLLSKSASEIKGITTGDTGQHKDTTRGYPNYTGWPRWDTVAHMQYWQGHIKQAFDGGLKLMVVYFTDSQALCQLAEKAVTFPPEGRQVHPCHPGDSWTTIMRQTKLAKEFARNTDWVEIAYTPQQAREIIGRNHMAWVLGIETDYMWGAETFDIDLTERLNAYFDAGIRAMYLAHQLNTKLAGAATYFQTLKTLQWIANCFYLDKDCNSSKPLGERPRNKIRIANFFCGGWGGMFPKWKGGYGEICQPAYNAWINAEKNGFKEERGADGDYTRNTLGSDQGRQENRRRDDGPGRTDRHWARF